MWPKVFQRKIAAFREEQRRELANVQHAQQAIRWTPPEFREEPRAAYEESLAKLQEAERQESLWWLRRPKMPGLTEDDVREVIGTILDEKGYWNITVGREKNRTAVVSYDDGEGTHYGSVKFHECEEWAEGLPDAADIPPERMEAFAAAMGKQIVKGENGETYTVDIKTGEIEEPAEEEPEPEPVQAKVISNGGKLMQENYGQGRVEVGPEDMEQWLREQQAKKEAKVEEKVVKEEPVEETITYVEVNDKVAQLRAAEKSNDILLIAYKARTGEVSARFIRVTYVSKDGKRFGVQDDQSREIRPGWYTDSVLAIYPPVPQKEMRGYADLLPGYKKGSDKVCMLPHDGNTVIFNNPVWTDPKNAETLEASGLWIRK